MSVPVINFFPSTKSSYEQVTFFNPASFGLCPENRKFTSAPLCEVSTSSDPVYVKVGFSYRVVISFVYAHPGRVRMSAATTTRIMLYGKFVLSIAIVLPAGELHRTLQDFARLLYLKSDPYPSFFSMIPARSSASVLISFWSSPSIMTRTLGSVPE